MLTGRLALIAREPAVSFLDYNCPLLFEVELSMLLFMALWILPPDEVLSIEPFKAKSWFATDVPTPPYVSPAAV